MARVFSLNPLKITQFFGGNSSVYKQFGLRGHNGLDFIALRGDGWKFINDDMFAMLPGVWHLLTERNKNGDYYGYGAAWILDYGEAGGVVRQFTFAHLKNRRIEYDNKNLHQGPRMAQMGNTGFSTGDHYHVTMKILKDGKIQNYMNGYHGADDPLPYLKKIGLTFING